MKSPTALLVGFAMMLAIGSAHAEDTRHWIARVGVHPIAPQLHAHPSFEVSNGVATSVGATYLFSRHWALEWFAALPVEHTLSVDGHDAGRFDLLPTTLSVQYHFIDAGERIRAYAGLGVAYANLLDEHTNGALAARALALDHSTGVAALVGLDMNLGSRWFASVDARWFDIDSRVRIDGVDAGYVQLDPYALGLSIGRRLR